MKAEMIDMKTLGSQILTFAILVLAIFVTGLEAFAKTDGTLGGGGGKTRVRRSSDVEVLRAIENVKKAFIFNYSRGSESSPLYDMWSDYHGDIKNPKLQEIIGKFFESGSHYRKEDGGTYVCSGCTMIEVAIRMSPIVPNIKDECPDDEPNAAGSVSARKIGATICMSVPVLSETHRDELRVQTLGVLIHELTHEFGYGEEEAKLVQSYFLDEVLSGRAQARSKLTLVTYAAQEHLALAEKHVLNKSGDAHSQACREVKAAHDGLFKDGRTVFWNLDSEDFLDQKSDFFTDLGNQLLNPLIEEAEKLAGEICERKVEPDTAKSLIENFRIKVRKNTEAKINPSKLVWSKY